MDGNSAKQVTQFTYLGAKITSDGKIDKEISVRIGNKRQPELLTNLITFRINNKVRIYIAAVLTILTYGCEIWNTTQVQIRLLESFHQLSVLPTQNPELE